MKLVKIAIEIIAYTGFGLLIGYFSASPAYEHSDPAQAQIKVSFIHAAERIGECRKRSEEEMNELAPNMRRELDCPRERLPLVLEIDLDGEPLYRGSHPPGGLWGDGPAAVYERFSVPAGRHELTARLRDTARNQGFDHSHTEVVDLAPGRNFVIDFRAEGSGFLFK